MFSDDRGYLIFPIKNEKYMNGLPNISKECTYSVNKKNVFRGLHINSFGKLITCISGKFIDIVVNMETSKVIYYNISPGDQIYCPANHGHGFLSLEENSVLSYHCEGIFGDEVGGLLNYKDPVLNLNLPISDSDIIINEKDSTAPFLEFEYFMLGASGYIGSHIFKELIKQGKKVLCLKERMEDIKSIKQKLECYKPKYFINAAGLTGVPNTKWCNTHKIETLMTNVVSQINIVNLCNEYNVHCTLIGSGAIFKKSHFQKFSYHPGDLTADDEYYSLCRIMLEEQIKPFNNCLLLRVNYPISSSIIGDINSKNLIYKILKYEQIEDVKLSVTNLDSLCPLIPKMLKNNATGVVNFINKGNLNIANLMKKIEVYYNLTPKKIIKSDRPNTLLICDKLDNATYNVEDIDSSVDILIPKLNIKLPIKK